jgi:4a-hydroxytetrahydrobiopterin dehydratase
MPKRCPQCRGSPRLITFVIGPQRGPRGSGQAVERSANIQCMAILTDLQRQEFTASYPDWELDGETIRRSYRFRDFSQAMGFVTRVALAAERADHHPDIDIRWSTITVALSTHSEGGLTQRDVDLASLIDTLA